MPVYPKIKSSESANKAVMAISLIIIAWEGKSAGDASAATMNSNSQPRQRDLANNI
jgi:hypothetical protein